MSSNESCIVNVHAPRVLKQQLKKQGKKLRVITLDSARTYYKHIIWLGDYMMFEFLPTKNENNNKTHILTLGVASFTNYASCIKVSQCDDEKSLYNQQQIITKELTKHMHENVCMMIKINMFLNTSMNNFLFGYSKHRTMTVSYNHTITYLQNYEKVMSLFVPIYIKPLFQEPLKYLKRRFCQFQGYHQDIFLQKQTQSCLQAFIIHNHQKRKRKRDYPRSQNVLENPSNAFRHDLIQISCNAMLTFNTQTYNSPAQLTTLQRKSDMTMIPLERICTRCKKIQKILSYFVCNSLNSDYNEKRLPVLNTFTDEPIKLLLENIVSDIEKLYGNIKLTLTTELENLRKIMEFESINELAAYVIILTLDSIICKTNY